jgi:hypothetical protein
MEERTFTTEQDKAARFQAGVGWVFFVLTVVCQGGWIFFLIRGKEDQLAALPSAVVLFMYGPLFVTFLFRSRFERRRLVVGEGAVKQFLGERLLAEIRLEDLEEIRTDTKEGRSNLMGWKTVTLVSRSGERIFHVFRNPEAVKEALLKSGCSPEVRILADPNPASGLYDQNPKGGTRVLAWLLAAGIVLSLGVVLCVALFSTWELMNLLAAVWFLLPASILLFRIGGTGLGYRKMDWVVGFLFLLPGVLFLYRLA